ncbi:hypothetical protein ACPPVS_13820 [Cellulomonas sp. McL0617]|uniref:hypothetical protein n=1 Tax=Cellulomonas sp. McL0617 TaxID=3415675 RepID=UPI003CE8F2C0
MLDGPGMSKGDVVVLTDDQELDFLRYALQGVPSRSWTSNEIDWDTYPFLSRTGPFDTSLEIAAELVQALRAHSTDDETVVVVWSGAGTAAVAMSSRNAQDNMAEIEEAWIFLLNQRVIVVGDWDGYVTTASLRDLTESIVAQLRTFLEQASDGWNL